MSVIYLTAGVLDLFENFNVFCYVERSLCIMVYRSTINEEDTLEFSTNVHETLAIEDDRQGEHVFCSKTSLCFWRQGHIVLAIYLPMSPIHKRITSIFVIITQVITFSFCFWINRFQAGIIMIINVLSLKCEICNFWTKYTVKYKHQLKHIRLLYSIV